ncbi:sensor histidine kinase [Peribacillus muralis]|uniref:sensor histidine kinase n=1 Tax=Peribacillus muralis TaxID=264697 RepID=UPI001F4F0C83|nr:sensor histidine kinase [Peribacillus muralis]MCK1994923.1 sensor histidine kinase [Peribacillus muralis]MCK2015531.1 sensor histidine kinase [Peribacillus muralis]
MFLNNMIRRLTNKMFSKILITYSVIILLTMFLLLLVLSRYYTEVIIQKEMDASTETLERVESYLQQKDEHVQYVMQQLYLKTDLIYNDIAFALQHDYDSYLAYRLDNYSENSSFIPNNLNTFFQAYFSQDPDINAVSLKSVSPGTKYEYINSHYRWNKYSDKREQKKGNQEGLPVHPQDLQLQQVEWEQDRTIFNNIQISRSINDPATLKKLGDLTVFYDTAGIQDLVRLRQSQFKGTVHIFQRNGDYLYSSEDGSIPEPLKDISFETNFKKIKWKGKNYYINTLADDHSGYLYVGFMPEDDIKKVTIVHRYMLLFTVSLSCIAIAVTYFAMRSYSKRIKKIETAIHEVRDGNLQIRIPDSRGKDELTAISESFNDMLDDLNMYIKDVYVLNIRQREAEMKALQSQIQPHFLYNTLEAIRMKAIADGSKPTSNMIYSLGQLFRYSLSSKEIVQISDEIQHAKEFIGLNQIRYSNRLHVTYEIPENCLDEKMLKFTLQPLIENYLIHGFRKETSNNELLIKVQRIDGTIEIVIKDNGKGIPIDKLWAIQTKLLEGNTTSEGSIGLSNVHQRIQLKYGQDFGIQISSKEGEETIVEVRIPAGRREQI